MSKIRIEITPEHFRDLLMICGDYDDPALQKLYEILQAKLERMIARQEYTASINESNPAKREKARQSYLDRKGIPEDFRWGPDGPQ